MLIFYWFPAGLKLKSACQHHLGLGLWQLESPNLRDMQLARSSSANMRLQPASLGVKRGYSRVSYGGITWEINRGVGTAKEKTLECTLAVTTAQPSPARWCLFPSPAPHWSCLLTLSRYEHQMRGFHWCERNSPALARVPIAVEATTSPAADYKWAWLHAIETRAREHASGFKRDAPEVP